MFTIAKIQNKSGKRTKRIQKLRNAYSFRPPFVTFHTQTARNSQRRCTFAAVKAAIKREKSQMLFELFQAEAVRMKF
jgi:hypothetical protein